MSEEHFEPSRETLRDTESLDLRAAGEPSIPEPLRRALEAALRTSIEGEVRFDDGYRALYAADGSNYRMPPIGVCTPKSLDDVERAIAVCRRFSVPVLSRGGGT